LVWIMALLEAITVPWVVMFHQVGDPAAQPKSAFHGFLVGAVGVWLLLHVVNPFLSRSIVIPIRGQRLNRINPLMSGLWGGVILALLFVIQRGLFACLTLPYPLDQIVVGFACTAASLGLTGAAYTVLVRITFALSITLRVGDGHLNLASVSFVNVALLGGLYEAVALPVLSTWTFCETCPVLFSLGSGLLGGALGGLLVCLVCNRLPRPVCWFGFRAMV
jgi:hypothetical protein